MNKSFSFFYFFIGIITIIVYSLFRIYCLKDGCEYGVDAFYHIRMADFFPAVCVDKAFLWTQLSLWKTNFYDKELGFHVLLSGLIYLQKIFKISFSAPFNFLNICTLSILVILTVFGTFKLKLKTGFIAAPLIVFISPLFLLRLNMVRAHILSIPLFLLITLVLISELSYRKKIFVLFFLSWLTAVTYSVPHIIFIAVTAYSISRFLTVGFSKSELSNNLFLFLIVLTGIAVGLVIHPQFPNSIYCWYIQGTLVVQKIFAYNTADVGLGLELLAPAWNTIFENISIFILLLFNFLFVVLVCEFRKDIKIITFFFIQLIMTVGFCFSERCIEYSVPAAVICFVIILDKLFSRTKLNNHVLVFLCILIMVSTFGVTLSENKSYLKSSQFSPCYSFAEWADKNIAPGAYIGQIRWGEFPKLFYSAPQYYYSMALDPMFSYYIYPEKTIKLENFRRLKIPIPPKELKSILGTDLVFISKYDRIPANYLIRLGAKVLYSGNDGWLLLL